MKVENLLASTISNQQGDPSSKKKSNFKRLKNSMNKSTFSLPSYTSRNDLSI